MTGITFLVDQLTGRSRIPESAAPVLPPSLREPERPRRKPDLRRGRKRPSKATGRRDGRVRIIAALDRSVGRTAVELADRAGVSVNSVRDHMPRLLKEGIARAERDSGPRAPRRFFKAGR